jgi:hypothetical protein
MSGAPSLQTEAPVKLGRDAGWILAFHREDRIGVCRAPDFELSRDDYFADITAVLPRGLDGGSYSFVIEGLTDKDYAKIAQTQPNPPRVVRLYLYWRDLDTGDLGILSNVLSSDFINGFQSTSKTEKHVADLVAELRIQSVTRRAGARKYETTIVARELVFDHVQKRRPCGEPIGYTDLRAAVRELMRRAGGYPDGEVPHEFHPLVPRSAPPSPEAPARPDDAEQNADGRQTILQALQTIASRMEQAANRHGRGMLLIRDGRLHVGQRPIPLQRDHAEPKLLSLDQGLLEVETLAPQERDPNWDVCDHGGEAVPVRAQYRLTLRGRGDLKPGDLVAFDAPPEEGNSTNSPLGGTFGALGDLAAGVVDMVLPGSGMAHPIQLYVAEVEHRLGRSSGFVTRVTGVQVGAGEPLQPDEAWDAHTAAAEPRETARGATHGTVERDAADAVVRLVRRETARLSGTEVAEVRNFRPAAAGAQAGQTSDLFRGLMPLTGPNLSRRAEIKRPSSAPASGVPYLTPFAWGRCGLVLPRYPGMRVALTHQQFRNDDPIEIGAMWQTGHIPEEACAGDWWLSLPSEAPIGNAPDASASGPPQDYTGKVSQDLTDNRGNRVIEVGALVIRIGSDRLKAAGARPDAPAQADSVTIEHPESKSMIQIKSDGSILISGKNVTLRATTKITLDAPAVEVP